jgi:hypothetical protein
MTDARGKVIKRSGPHSHAGLRPTKLVGARDFERGDCRTPSQKNLKGAAMRKRWSITSQGFEVAISLSRKIMGSTGAPTDGRARAAPHPRCRTAALRLEHRAEAMAKYP